MTTRRQFIRGAVAVAVSVALPTTTWHGTRDGLYWKATDYLSRNEWQPMGYGESFATEMMPIQRELNKRMAAMLVQSMKQTREIVAANVLNKAFGGSKQ